MRHITLGHAAGSPPMDSSEVAARTGIAAAANTARSVARAVFQETLEQACPPECQGAQCAFKDSMIH